MDKPKPTIIGLYGVSGSGKSTLLSALRSRLPQYDFKFFEGSEVLFRMVKGGKDAFVKASRKKQKKYRQLAIDHIAEDCAASGMTGIVTGHLLLPSSSNAAGFSQIDTDRDWANYTHIIYLSCDTDCIEKWIASDASRSRTVTDAASLRDWQIQETSLLSDICQQHGILYIGLYPDEEGDINRKAIELVQDFSVHNEQHNESKAIEAVDDFVNAHGPYDAMIVLDADKIITPEDTGTEFWRTIVSEHMPDQQQDPLHQIFSGPAGYTYAAFRQATLLYENIFNDKDFHRTCSAMSEKIKLYPEFEKLIAMVQTQETKRIGIIILTSGIAELWRIKFNIPTYPNNTARGTLAKDNLAVIGGSRIKDKFVVTGQVKGMIVSHLRLAHNMYVYAFGDSRLDLDMLSAAHKAVVVVGSEDTRSKSMEQALKGAVTGGLSAEQLLLQTLVPRLSQDQLPYFDFDEFLKALFKDVRVQHADECDAALYLATLSRNADIFGQQLGDVHNRIGRHLALTYLVDIMGTEPYHIRHVQGNLVAGQRLRNEKSTLIVPLMRGGLYMAMGVWAEMPQAMFAPAEGPQSLKPSDLEHCTRVVLVDSVINEGTTIYKFVERIRVLQPDLKISVITNVLQRDSCRPFGMLDRAKRNFGRFNVIALRISDNKFKGSKGTDTGNRLFNTMHRE